MGLPTRNLRQPTNTLHVHLCTSGIASRVLPERIHRAVALYVGIDRAIGTADIGFSLPDVPPARKRYADIVRVDLQAPGVALVTTSGSEKSTRASNVLDSLMATPAVAVAINANFFQPEGWKMQLYFYLARDERWRKRWLRPRTEFGTNRQETFHRRTIPGDQPVVCHPPGWPVVRLPARCNQANWAGSFSAAGAEQRIGPRMVNLGDQTGATDELIVPT